MAKAKHFVPTGLSTLTPQLVVSDATALVSFLEKAFGAQLVDKVPGPEGKGILHGHCRVGDSVIFLSDASGFAKPTTANSFVYVEDVDTVFGKAVAAGGKVVAPITDMFWGDRWGMIEDPFGNIWQLATHVEDLSPDEIKQRMMANAKQP
jgi:PhnB protein